MTSWVSARLRSLGLALLILALVAQVATVAYGMPVDPPSPATQAVAVLGVLCHAGGAAPGHRAPGRHCPDCALCPLCQSISAPFAMLAPGPALPLPVLVPGVPARTQPPARAPPAIAPITAYPRGPPAQA